MYACLCTLGDTGATSDSDRIANKNQTYNNRGCTFGHVTNMFRFLCKDDGVKKLFSVNTVIAWRREGREILLSFIYAM